MELQLIEEDFHCDFLLINYTKLIKNSNELCSVCQVDETEEGKQWDRYKMVCQHVAHTRCLRRWCAKKGSISCPYCGHIKRKSKNKYCYECDTFGHSLGNCKNGEVVNNDIYNYCCFYTRLTNLCLRLK